MRLEVKIGFKRQFRGETKPSKHRCWITEQIRRTSLQVRLSEVCKSLSARYIAAKLASENSFFRPIFLEVFGPYLAKDF